MKYKRVGKFERVIETLSDLTKYVVRGPSGAIQFAYSEINGRKIAFDLGYHSYKPMYEGDKPITDSCPYLDGAPCYYDGSTLAADKPLIILTYMGEDALWLFLEEEYMRVFGDEN